MPSATLRTPKLTQDVALLDLISAAAATPEAVRERAHALAQDHQVAAADQVERALTGVMPVADPYVWDRPLTLSDREAQVAHAKSEEKIVSDTVNRFFRWGKPVGGIMGGVISLVLTWALFMGTLLTDHLGEWRVLGPLCLVGTVGMVLWGRAREKVLDAIIAPGGEHRGSAADQRLEQLAPYSPSSKQMTHWLAHPEVAAQARAWIASPCGLMAEDACLLDARVEVLEENTKVATQVALAHRLGLSTHALP